MATEKLKGQWSNEQVTLKQQLMTTDDHPDWSLDPGENQIKLIGGVDISFIKGNETDACAALVVLEYPSLKVVYKDFQMVKLTEPYISTFLAFREVDHLVNLVEKLRQNQSELLPQVILVDGNGYLHPRGFGLACHLGVLTDIPTIGVGKNFLVMDGQKDKCLSGSRLYESGLGMEETKEKIQQECTKRGDWIKLIGDSGTCWGAGLNMTEGGGRKPLFVSIGHRVSLETAVNVVKACCQYKNPEPIRQADLGSREYLRTLSQTSFH